MPDIKALVERGIAKLPAFTQRPVNYVWRRVQRHWWLDKRSRLVEEALGFRYTLPDVFFDWIGMIELLWLTDMFDALMFVPTALLVVTHERPWRVISRMGCAWSLASLIRITTVAITSVPDPRPSCEYVVGNVFTTFTLHRCGDAIYSGHTLIFVISAMAWSSFSPRNWIGRGLTFFVWCLCIAGSLIVIANRAHYTIDVLLAWYIAPGCWYVAAWFWYWHVTKKGRLLRIEFPMEVGRHRMKDSPEMVERRRVMLGLMPDGTPGEVELTPPLCEVAPSTLQTEKRGDSAGSLVTNNEEKKVEEGVVTGADGSMGSGRTPDTQRLGDAFDEDFNASARHNV
ncbi:hypothetical protein DL89DRAFT_254751 [Linderina pennispora]|uniref:Sphingomyelin synthase-like domain-containing protein n=1 Tax=Linderina pennispora TaxID=61395 RepID=A0A1Y1WNP8_9FUNG|nr:uncharacterized protein DL89DRAFT_254751 [Linderina pennispora]ORX74995.1 hypothetical protein DL89DRAFT_254751 [Linderina pennispora]